MSNERLIEIIQAGDDAQFVPIWRTCQPYSAISIEHGLAIFRATRFIVENRIPGVFAECGVGQGGSMMIAMKTLQMLGAGSRRFILFDRFGGAQDLSRVDSDDHDSPGPRSPAAVARPIESQPGPTLEQIQANIATIGYDESKIRYRRGDVRRVLARSSLPGIALLRSHSALYDNTYAVLMYLYPRIVEQGVLILDDSCSEAQRAVTDYFAEAGPAPSPRPAPPLFHWIDATGRVAVRHDPPDDELPAELTRDPDRTWAKPMRDGQKIPTPDERYDYVPAGLRDPNLIRYFPTLVANDPRRNKWPFLRSAAAHIWRTDERSVNQNIGVLSLEEAILLHNLASPYAGQRGLAIGCHYAWSTAHLLAAGLHLDVVDPKLSRSDQWSDVDENLSAIPTQGTYRLWAAYSPSIIPALRESKPEPWSFVFIDGDHEGTAPRRDAEIVAQYCAADATVVLHDLISPHVAAGLEVFQAAGWNVEVFNTMQVLGVAWRGKIKPVRHAADPQMPSLDLPHLRGFLK